MSHLEVWAECLINISAKGREYVNVTEGRWTVVEYKKSLRTSHVLDWVYLEIRSTSELTIRAPGCAFSLQRGPPLSRHPDPASKHSHRSFFLAQAPPPLSCPAQWGRILLVAMTSAQCVCDMQPLDTSRFKEELLSDADATPARTPDPPLSLTGWKGALLSPQWSSGGVSGCGGPCVSRQWADDLFTPWEQMTRAEEGSRMSCSSWTPVKD